MLTRRTGHLFKGQKWLEEEGNDTVSVSNQEREICIANSKRQHRSFIIKQSRYVEKYADSCARGTSTYRRAFYQKIACPRKYSVCPCSRVLMHNMIALEDLGKQMTIPFCMI
jgi:hypothetical protein